MGLAGTIAFFFVVVFLRANATYWIGRGVTAGGERSRFAPWFGCPPMQKAAAFMKKWGPFAVPVSFLTFGLQTAVQATAGVTRMPLKRYLPSMVVGGLAWATVYGTVGFAAIWAAALGLFGIRLPA